MSRHYSEIPLWQDVREAEWTDWRWQVRNRLRSLTDLKQVIQLTPAEEEGLAWAGEPGNFPTGINPYYAALMDPEDPGCPIRRQALPVGDEGYLSANDFVDPLHEDVDSPVPHVTHRYPDRVLFIVTEMCPMYCRHCTRRRKVGSREGMLPKPELDTALEYIAATPVIRDVLISGGDPLSLGDGRLEYLLARLREIPHVEIVRFGTRVLVTNPYRVTDAFCQLVQQYHPVWVNTHFNHPLEVTEAAAEACARLANAGVPLGNQTVLLRGVNDCPHIQKELVHRLVKARVRPYYLYQCDLSQGIEHFRTPVSKGIEIIEHLRGHTSGYAVPTFVVDAPGGGGKIPVGPQYIVSQSPDKIVLRNYEGVICTYPEPAHGDTHDPADCEYCQRAAGRPAVGVAGLLQRRQPAGLEVSEPAAEEADAENGRGDGSSSRVVELLESMSGKPPGDNEGADGT